MKLRTVVLVILLVIFADQALKIWVKTSMYYGGHITIFKDWFRLYFIENAGMAWGWKFGGDFGKLALTLFRLVAVIFGVFYIKSIVKKEYHKGFIICVALIFAGALGNLIDSMFYGLIFDKGMTIDKLTGDNMGYVGLATMNFKGYGSFLHGNVVDMLYVPIIENKIMPGWVPFIGGQSFTFFSPIFNLADAAISVGVIAILIFQKRFFKEVPAIATPTVETNAVESDEKHVL